MIESLEIQELHQGQPYSTGQASRFTLIHSQAGAPFVGDAALYLEQTPCEYLIFLSACGAIDKNGLLSVGSVVTPRSCLNLESFSNLVMHSKLNSVFTPHAELLDWVKINHPTVDSVQCASLGSYKLEEDYAQQLLEDQIDILQMEISAFFSASQSIQRKSLALCYVTDILFETHIFEPMSSARKSAIEVAQQRAFKIVKELAEELSSR